MDKPILYSFWTKTLFILYAILCLILFVYVRFPYYVLKPKLETAIGNALSTDISMGKVQPKLPFGMTVEGLKLNNEIIARKLTLSPSLFSLITGSLGLSFHIDQERGDLKGKIKTSFKHPGNPLDVSLTMKEFDAGSFRKFIKGGSEIGGTLSGNFAIKTSQENFKDSKGEISMVWKDGQIPLNIPSFPVAAIPFSTFEVNAKMDKGVLTIEKAVLNGNDISGTVDGDVRLGMNMQSSQLNLRGNLKLSPGYRTMLGNLSGDNLTFTLGGTAGMPLFNMGS